MGWRGIELQTGVPVPVTKTLLRDRNRLDLHRYGIRGEPDFPVGLAHRVGSVMKLGNDLWNGRTGLLASFWRTRSDLAGGSKGGTVRGEHLRYRIPRA